MIKVATKSAMPASGRMKPAGAVAAANVPTTRRPIQAGEPKNIRIAKASWKRLTGLMPGRPSRCQYCMLPWHQRRSRRMNSSSVAGFSSKLWCSKGSTRTSKPARRISTASIWSWLSTWPPTSTPSGSTGNWQCVMNGLRRMAALWPQ